MFAKASYRTLASVRLSSPREIANAAWNDMSDAAVPPAAGGAAGDGANPAPPQRAAVGVIIARNSFWMLFDSLYGMAASFYCSIAVARGLGPELMSDYNYVIVLASVLRLVTELAIPMTFRRFASELMGRQDFATLRTLIRFTLRVQTQIAALGVTVGLVIALASSTHDRRVFGALAVVSVVPALLSSIPTGTLQATENVRLYIVGSLAGITVNLVGITLSVLFHLGLLGVMVSFVSARFIDFALRFMAFRRVYAGLPGRAADASAVLDPTLKKRLYAFALRQLPQIAFQILLWERFEVLFLKRLGPAGSIAFFSISVTLMQYVLQLPASLAGSAGTTLMVQQ